MSYDAPAGLTAENVDYVTSGVDWITATIPADGEAVEPRLLWLNSLLLDISKEGNKYERRGMSGYYGHGVDRNFIGDNGERWLVQFTGRQADRAFARIDWAGFHFARMDIQATVSYRAPVRGVGDYYHDTSVAATRNVSPSWRWQVSRFVTHDGGSTTYIGSPSSRSRGYIYDKAAESKDPVYTGCWRYEVRHRNERATQCGTILSAARPNYREVVFQAVSDWFAQRGVDCRHWASGPRSVYPPLKTRPSDAASKLLWLERSVKPALDWLRSQGYEQAALEALGLYNERYTPEINEEP